MAHLDSSAQLDLWASIRDSALQVVLLTRRADNFWSLPVIPRELGETWAHPGSLDDLSRKAEAFGHPSITVSCNALGAIGAAAGSLLLQREVPPTLRAIDTFRAHDGGYGTPGGRKDQIEINAVPRHTAMAVVSHLLFSLRGSPSAISALLGPSIKWLLDHQLRRGGWPYDQATRPALGYLSTASTLTAFSLFLDLGHAPATLASSIKQAFPKAYAALVENQRGGVWIGDGAPPNAQIINSAFALRMLRIADRAGTLKALVPSGLPTVDGLVSSFGQNLREGGWPESTDRDVADPVSSISALQVVLEAGDPSGLGEKLEAVEARILSAWREGHLVSQMTSWDWQCLALLAARFVPSLAPSKAEDYARLCETLRSAGLNGKIGLANLSPLPEAIRDPAEFALSGGRRFPPRSFKDRVRSVWKTLAPKMAERTAWAILVFMVLAIYYYFVGAEPGDVVKRLFRG